MRYTTCRNTINKPQKSIAAYKKAIEINPDCKEDRDSLSAIYFPDK